MKHHLRFIVCTDETINIFRGEEFVCHLTEYQLGTLMKKWYGQ